MAFITFNEEHRPRATVLLLVNHVPFSCYQGSVFELPEVALDKLTESGIPFELAEAPADTQLNGARATVQLIGVNAPTRS